MLKVTYVITGAVFLGLVYFLTTFGNPVLVLLAAALFATLAFFFWRRFDPDGGVRASLSNSLLMVGGATLFGTLLRWLLGFRGNGGWDWLGILVALGLTAGLHAMVGWGSQAPCFLCKLPMENQASLVCPRCQQTVCARPSCWDSRHLRCTFCHEREVVVLPIRDDWWSRRLGPRLDQGQCDSCYKEARETDLRECGQCHWPLCKRCWDYLNGRCPRCGWIIPDLPLQLQAYVGGGQGSRSRQRSGYDRGKTLHG